MLNLALICTNPSPTLRPSMSTVVSMLDGKTPIQLPSVKQADSKSYDFRFKSLERMSDVSQMQNVSTEGLWVGTLVNIDHCSKKESSLNSSSSNVSHQAA